MKRVDLNIRMDLYPLMTSMMSQFRVFLNEIIQVDNGRYKYITPVETKGALLFDLLYSNEMKTLFPTEILYPRGYDFLSDEERIGKTSALIDDTTFSGGTLRRNRDKLSTQGLVVDTYSFVMDMTPALQNRDEQIRENTPFAIPLRTKKDYNKYLFELKHLSSQARIPASYDQLVFKTEQVTTENLADILHCLDSVGQLLSYGKRGSHQCWAVILNQQTPSLREFRELPSCVPPKIRLWFNENTQELTTVPMWYPQINDIDMLSPFSNDIISNSSDDVTKIQDALDSVSIAGMVYICQPVFSKLGSILRNTKLENKHLQRHFTKRIADKLEKRISNMLFSQIEGGCDRVEINNHIERESRVIPYRVLAKSIAQRLKAEYESQELPRYLRESKGISIREIIEENADYDEASVHAAVDFIIDFCYATPFFDMSRMPFRRALRTTEIPSEFLLIEKLAAMYTELSPRGYITSTEAKKMLPIFKNVYDSNPEGYTVTTGPGGQLTAAKDLGDVDRRDIWNILLRSSLFKANKVKGMNVLELREDFDLDVIIDDPSAREFYGNVQAVCKYVTAKGHKLTPPKRATLISVITSKDKGLGLLKTNAGIMAKQFGNAIDKINEHEVEYLDETTKPDIAPIIKDYIGAFERARKEAKTKIIYLGDYDEHIRELRNLNPRPKLFEKRLDRQFQLPKRWEHLLRLWDWYIDSLNMTSRIAIAGALEKQPREDILNGIGNLMDIGPYLKNEDDIDWHIRKAGVIWRSALSGQGLNRTEDELASDKFDGRKYYAHFDLADSKLQLIDRIPWMVYSGNMIYSWSKLFDCKSSCKFETQAESGFIWADEISKCVDASIWSIYSLHVMSEIRKPQHEWIPVFCLCEDEGEDIFVGKDMGLSAKVTKGIARADSEYISQKVRKQSKDSLEDRIFILGSELINSIGDRMPGCLVDRSEYAKSLSIDDNLVSISIDKYLSHWLEKLPKISKST